jgi:hypothetical protein
MSCEAIEARSDILCLISGAENSEAGHLRYEIKGEGGFFKVPVRRGHYLFAHEIPDGIPNHFLLFREEIVQSIKVDASKIIHEDRLSQWENNETAGGRR